MDKIGIFIGEGNNEKIVIRDNVDSFKQLLK